MQEMKARQIEALKEIYGRECTGIRKKIIEDLNLVKLEIPMQVNKTLYGGNGHKAVVMWGNINLICGAYAHITHTSLSAALGNQNRNSWPGIRVCSIESDRQECASHVYHSQDKYMPQALITECGHSLCPTLRI